MCEVGGVRCAICWMGWGPWFRRNSGPSARTRLFFMIMRAAALLLRSVLPRDQTGLIQEAATHFIISPELH